jgi:AraC-like DNA-binding protein
LTENERQSPRPEPAGTPARPARFRGDRVSAYRELIRRSVGHFRIEPLSDRFEFAGRSAVLPGLSIAQISSSPVRVERTAGMAADEARDLTLAIFENGLVTASQRGREVTLSGGGAYLFSPQDPLRMRRTASRVINISLRRADLAPMVSDLDGVLMTAIPGGLEAMRLLAGYAGLAATRAPSPELGLLAAGHVHDLIALALGATRSAARIAGARGLRAARHAEIFARANRFIAWRCDDPDLRPEEIARRLGVSLRLLQKVFAERGASPMDRVWEERVGRAARLLAAPATADRSVTDIAFACGFNDSSHFTRAFAARMGVTPLRWRRGAR